MADSAWLLVGAGLVLGAVVVVLARHAYLAFPDQYPPDALPVARRTYEAVRVGIVGGSAVGATGCVLALVDTVGTVTTVGPRKQGTLEAAAVAIPEWLASTAPVAGAAVVAGSGAVLLVALVRNWLAE